MRAILQSKWCLPSALVALACIASLSSIPGNARPAKDVENPAKRLLEKASKSLGESAPWETRVEKGLHIAWNTEGWGTLKADYTRYVKKPDKLKIDQDNSAYDHPFFRTYYYDGGDAWYMVNLNTGRNPQVTANMKALLERVDGIAFYLAACDTFFMVPRIPADSILSGDGLLRAGCVLKGDTTLFDIDAKTHLLRRRIENDGARVYILEDYRNVRKRKVPFHVTVYDAGKKTNEFLWRDVKFDEKLDDATFEENRPPQQ
jgi:outer membrane lipoprotein-sorting protein